MKEEIKRLTMENEALAERVEALSKRVRLLESEQEERDSVYSLAKAIHEIQDELKSLHPEVVFTNKIYAPNKVGMR
tara:strand:- start:451 stop:678 length:228 start_codon:yes stop_codon:yes gene_type:complete